MYTDPELIERLRAEKPPKRRAAPPAPMPAPEVKEPTLCDSCGRPVDDPYRFRHVDCPPPSIPDGVREVLDRLRRERS